MGSYRILSIDGGGIRGLFAAVLLDRLSQRVPFFLDSVDLAAGTSTGGIIALGLALGLKPSDLVSLYKENATKIFDNSWKDEIRDVVRIIGAEYDNGPLKEVLQGVFKTATLGELQKRVIVPAFDLDNQAQPPALRTWKPKFFHNFPGPDSDGDELLVEVALRTSAAPTYFPVYEGYIDGGVVANNPSMAALAQAIDATTGGQTLGDVRLLSLGTGATPAYIQGQDHHWGVAQWAKPLISILMDGMLGVADYQCARLLHDRYWRLEPVLPQPIALDAADKTNELVEYAEQVPLDDTVAWLKANF